MNKHFYLSYGTTEDGRILSVITTEHPHAEKVEVCSLEVWAGPLTDELVQQIHAWCNDAVLNEPWILRN